MSRLWRIAEILAGALLLLAAPVLAQTIPHQSECWQAGIEPRCEAVRAERQRELYGLASIEQLQRDGVQVRRAFFVDGSGLDVGAISFVRAPGRVPEVTFQAPGQADLRPPPLVAALPAETWREALALSVNLDRLFAPRPPDPRRLCMHGWTYHVESSDPAFRRREPSLRRRTENACEQESPAPEFAHALARLAAPLFPACMLLDDHQHANPVMRLYACAWLSGDLMAAAEVRNALDVLADLDEDDGIGAVGPAFAADARLDWGGRTVTGRDPAARRWLRRFLEHPYASLRTTRIHGETQHRVLVDGFVTYHTDDGEGRHATVAMVWSRDGDYRMTIEQASVGPYQADPLE